MKMVERIIWKYNDEVTAIDYLTNFLKMENVFNLFIAIDNHSHLNKWKIL